MPPLSDVWTNVTDSLPPARKWVWVKVDAGFVTIGNLTLEGKWYWDATTDHEQQVVGWQELSKKKPE